MMTRHFSSSERLCLKDVVNACNKGLKLCLKDLPLVPISVPTFAAKKVLRHGFQNDPAENPINLNSLNFDPKNHNPSDQKFLDLLRDSEDSGKGSQPSANEDGGTPILSKSGTGSGHGSHGRQQKFRDRYYKTDFVITQLL